MAEKETKIAKCPMLGCGKKVRHVEGSGQIWCPCGYELVSSAGLRPEVPHMERELIERHNKLSIAAHNALARPKDVEARSYEDVIRNVECSKEVYEALLFAFTKHAGQTDKSGIEPYFLHCIRVMMTVPFNSTCQVVAILHDTIEDTDTTEQEVRENFGGEVADAVIAITHLPNEPRENYIKRVGMNPVATIVKLSDISDNRLEWRLGNLSSETRRRLEQKYATYYSYLTQPAVAAKLSELMAPRDVAGLEEAVNSVFIDLWPMMGVTSMTVPSMTKQMVAAIRDFCDPETTRQKSRLLDNLVRIRNESAQMGLEKNEPAITRLAVEFSQTLEEAAKIIADCEATT